MSRGKISLARRQQQMRARQKARPPRRGRPLRKIDAAELYELAFSGYSKSAMARQLGCDRKTLNRFADLIAAARQARAAEFELVCGAAVNAQFRADYAVIFPVNKDSAPRKARPHRQTAAGKAAANQRHAPRIFPQKTSFGGNCAGKS